MNPFICRVGSFIYNLPRKFKYLLFNFVQRMLFSIKKKHQNRVYVLHQSDNFLVLNKPYDMIINSNNPNLKYSLQVEVRKLFPELVSRNLCHEFYFVHRLDYATSGVICLALNKRAAKAATTAFERRKAKKYYLALVHGHVEESYVVITKAIGEDAREKDGNHKMCTADNIFCEKPRQSYTALLVLERGLRDNKPATKVLLCPGTGRRHQLRVHCFHIGHTIIGDYTYSGRRDTEPHRTFLHSFRLLLNNEVENLDVSTKDPFDTVDPWNRWKPMQIIRNLNESTFIEINNLM